MLDTQQVAEPPATTTCSNHWRTVAAAMFVCGWGGNQFTPLLLMYRRLGGYSALSVDAFLGAYVVGLIPGLLLAGPMSDRRGRRPVMVGGTVASVVASLVLSFGGQGAWPIYVGRLITGIAVGIAMSVGSSWVKELSTGADNGLAARRASLCQTAGFGLGAGVAGALAQWGPWPMVTPYAVHILTTVAIPVLLLRVPETRTPSPHAAGSVRELLTELVSDLRIPPHSRRRFRLVILPMAPWVFGAAGLAYAVMPQLVDSRVGHWGLAYATGLTVLTLGTGAAVQPVAKRLHGGPGARTGRASVVAMAVMLLGVVLCAADSVLLSPWLAMGAAVTLGAAYGIAVVSGLLEIQRMAGHVLECGIDAGVLEDLPHGRGGDLHPEYEQFAVHAPIPPLGVLPDQAQHQNTDGTHGRRPARPLGFGPGSVPLPDQVAVPAQHRVRAYQQPHPAKRLRSVDVGQQRGDHPALGCARNATPHRPGLHHPGAQHAAHQVQDGPVADAF